MNIIFICWKLAASVCVVLMKTMSRMLPKLYTKPLQRSQIKWALEFIYTNIYQEIMNQTNQANIFHYIQQHYVPNKWMNAGNPFCAKKLVRENKKSNTAYFVDGIKVNEWIAIFFFCSPFSCFSKIETYRVFRLVQFKITESHFDSTVIMNKVFF